VYAGIEHGVAIAKDHFIQSGIVLTQEKQAFSSIVRLHAKHYLKKDKLESIEIEHTNLCGLWMRASGYKIKVWHLQDEDQDVLSIPCSRVFEQYMFMQDEDTYPLIPLRVYWRVRRQNGILEVFLACPKYDDPKSLECYWFEQVEDPAASIRTAITTPTGDIDLDADERQRGIAAGQG
jgi:hypothetical protein